GTRQDLGTLPGHTSSQARGINGAGNIVGWSGTTEGADSRAVLWANGEPHDLGTLPGDVSSQALAVNTVGQVARWAGSRAFVWDAGAMTDLIASYQAGAAGCSPEPSPSMTRDTSWGTVFSTARRARSS